MGELFFFVLSCVTFVLAQHNDGGNDYYPDYTTYHNVESYGAAVKQLAALNPDIVRLETTRSSQGQDVHLIRLSDLSLPKTYNGQDKPKILITFGEHAREFIPVESFFHLVYNLTTDYRQGDPLAQFLISNVEFLLIGMLNPDGRRYLETSKDYCWRKTGTAVDLNRNFGWEFGGPGSSGDPKSEEYRGPSAFSEAESRFLRDLAHKEQPVAYMSMHSGAQDIFVSYADTESKRIRRRHFNVDATLTLAREMKHKSGNYFQSVGIVYEANDYTADGTIGDYMAGVLNIPFVFVLEIWGDRIDYQNCFRQFNPRADHLKQDLDALFPVYFPVFLEGLRYATKLTYSPDAAKTLVDSKSAKTGSKSSELFNREAAHKSATSGKRSSGRQQSQSSRATESSRLDDLHSGLDRVERMLGVVRNRLRGWRKGEGFAR